MEFIDDLKKRLGQKLPAEKAHADLMNYKRQSAEEILSQKQDVKLSSVLCLLFKEEGEWKFYLMLRNSYNGVHSAQVSFPGGRREKSDLDFKETALREAKEELNINPDQVEILGELSTLYIPPSNFLVYPFVGVATQIQNIQPDPIEVKSVIKASVRDILKPDAIQSSPVKMSGVNRLIPVKHYTIDGHIVWGATGMMLAELAFLLRDIGFDTYEQ